MLSINLSGIEKDVKPEITKLIKSLNNAKQTCSSIYVPKDFAYYSQATQISQNIGTIISSINNVNSLLTTTINNFTQVERKNQALLGSLSSKITVNKINSKNYKSSGNVKSKIQSNSRMNDFVQASKSAIGSMVKFAANTSLLLDYNGVAQITGTAVCVNGFSANLDLASWFSTGCAKVAETVDSILSWGSEKINSLLSFGKDKLNDARDWLGNMANAAVEGMKNIGSKIASMWSSGYVNILKPALNIFQTVVASVTNVVESLGKGLAEVIEDLFKFVVILLTGVSSIFTGLWDLSLYLSNLSSGKKWESATVALWKDTMSFVSESYVENYYKSLYENTLIGQWLDKHAATGFKSGGIASQIASGIGYLLGILALAGATGVPPFVVAGAAGIGKGTR